MLFLPSRPSTFLFEAYLRASRDATRRELRALERGSSLFLAVSTIDRRIRSHERLRFVDPLLLAGVSSRYVKCGYNGTLYRRYNTQSDDRVARIPANSTPIAPAAIDLRSSVTRRTQPRSGRYAARSGRNNSESGDGGGQRTKRRTKESCGGGTQRDR